MTKNDSINSEKPKKSKGPIRFEAILPFSIFVVAVWAYFFLFFDIHLRHGLEYVATLGNGAEVNIERLHTSFWRASLEIDQIQVTNPTVPTKNTIQIGSIKWRMLWDALLRGKIAIDEASINEIALGAPRKKPGRVLPPAPPSSGSAFDKIRQQALEKAKEQFSGNALGDLAAIVGGADPMDQLKKVEGTLKTKARVEQLQKELGEKQKQWQARIAALPQEKELKEFEARLKSVKTSGFSGPQEVEQSVKQFDAIFKDADGKIKQVQEAGSALKTDLTNYQNSLKELDGLVRQDIKDLEARVKIPQLDVKTLSMSIFGPMFLGRVQEAEGYMAKARKYMPPPKTAEEKAKYEPPTPHERAKGRNYKFGRAKAYPLFWLKKAAISSKAIKGADWSGDLSGSIEDVTDDPPVLGRPMIATFKGEFPAQQLFGVIGKLTVDHTTDNAFEKLDLQVASFPVLGRALLDSSEVKLGFGNAEASADFNAELRGSDVKIVTSSVFQKSSREPSAAALARAADIAAGAQALDCDPLNSTTTTGGAQCAAPTPENGINKPSSPVTATSSFLLAEAKQPILADILKKTVAEIPKVTLNASAEGPWSALRFSIDSNLGRDLASALERQVQAKINEAKAKIEAMINQEINKHREQLTAEFNKAKGQIEQLLKSKEEEINKAKAQVEQAKNDAVNGNKKQLENEGKKALDELKKKFNF